LLSMSQPDPDFEWTPEPWGAALRSRALAGVACHGFTTRQLRLRGNPPEERREWARVAAMVGVGADRLARVHQVHGRDVDVLRREDRWPGGTGTRPAADILVSDDPGVALAVQVADCIPLLVADPETGAAAAAHAGWRGIAGDVPGATVRALAKEFGARPPHLVAAAGPSIGPCCYEVGPEVREALAAAGGAAHGAGRWLSPSGLTPPGLRPRPGHAMLDLWQALEDQLVAAGVAPGNIHVARLCTACHPREYWSYRRDGAGTGRLAGVIRPGRLLRP
jgi:hypothetical protein